MPIIEMVIAKREYIIKQRMRSNAKESRVHSGSDDMRVSSHIWIKDLRFGAPGAGGEGASCRPAFTFVAVSRLMM